MRHLSCRLYIINSYEPGTMLINTLSMFYIMVKLLQEILAKFFIWANALLFISQNGVHRTRESYRMDYSCFPIKQIIIHLYMSTQIKAAFRHPGMINLAHKTEWRQRNYVI